MPRIIKRFIPKSNDNRPGYSMDPDYITVHETANKARSADAELHSRYVKNPNTAASWHFTVDDTGNIYQHLPLDENGWHAGDGGRGEGNRNSIGIETCVNRGGDFEQAIKNVQWLVRYLMKKKGIPLSRVVPHKHWSGKNCPTNLLSRWDSFKAGIEGVKGVSTSTANNVLKDGSKGEEVKKAQQQLMDAGFDLPEYGADGSFGEETEEAVMKLQEAAGVEQDGVIGPNTQLLLDVLTNKEVLEKGDDGDVVEAVQQLLQKNGVPLPEYGADGDYGNETKAGVEKYQRSVGLSVDGKVGQNTLNTLLDGKGAKDVGGMVVVTYDKPLNVRDKPSWDKEDVVGQVKKGEAFTIKEKLTVGGTTMYRLKSGLYITGHEHYVKVK